MLDVNPESLFGGVWEPIQNRFLLCSGSSFALGSVGGEETHILTAGETPSHHGHMPGNTGDSPDEDTYFPDANSGNDQMVKHRLRQFKLHNSNEYYIPGYTSGNNQPHNNMPPYLTVSAYKRIS